MKVEDIIAFLIQLELKIKFGAKRSNRWRLNGKESRGRAAGWRENSNSNILNNTNKQS